jgi:type IV pilus assembly protein PilC
MADFKYTAQSNNGEVINGVVEAANQFEAVEKIRQTCPIIISIEEYGGSVVQKKQAVRRIKAKELSLMCNRFYNYYSRLCIP